MPRALLVVFDSLRKDVFDACRHPLLEGWRERGVVFERCYSQSGFTPISFASFLTGCFPSRSGVAAQRPAVRESGERSREGVFWSLGPGTEARLVLEEARPLGRSAFSLFEARLLAIAAGQTNAFPELAPGERTPSLEWGGASTSVYGRVREVGEGDDWLVVLRVFDTHLPYGRGVSPLDAGDPGEVKRRVAALFAADGGRRLLREVAVPALERALDYLSPIGRFIGPRADFVAVMSDHGDRWSADPREVGHASFLCPEVLQVPLVVIDGRHRGRHLGCCNNVDVLPTLLLALGRRAEWRMDGDPLPLDGAVRDSFRTEANSMEGERAVFAGAGGGALPPPWTRPG